jgi:hypothetical protein
MFENDVKVLSKLPPLTGDSVSRVNWVTPDTPPGRQISHLHGQQPKITECLCLKEVNMTLFASNMLVDGRKEMVHFDKIVARVSKLAYGLSNFVDAIEVSQKV